MAGVEIMMCRALISALLIGFSNSFKLGNNCVVRDTFWHARMNRGCGSIAAVASSDINMPKDQKNLRIFIFGVGYTGLGIAKAAQRRWGTQCSVTGTCRTKEKAMVLKQLGIEAFEFDLDGDYLPLQGEALDHLNHATHVITTIPPIADFNRDPVLEFHRSHLLNSQALEWVGYLSTTGVYGDHKGDWVAEDSETLIGPNDRAFHRLEAEATWQDMARSLPGCVHIFRLAGIYGPGRSALDTVRRLGFRPELDPAGGGRDGGGGSGGAAGDVGAGKYVSRIHVADIAEAVLCAMRCDCRHERSGGVGVGGGEGGGGGGGNRDNSGRGEGMVGEAGKDGGGCYSGQIFNVADDVPAPRAVVLDFARQLLGLPAPPATAEPSRRGGGLRALSADNKRVDNTRMKELLLGGRPLRYPDYRAGLEALAAGDTYPFD